MTVSRPEPDPQAIAAPILPDISATEPYNTPPMINPKIDHLTTNLPSSSTDRVKVDRTFEERAKKELRIPCIQMWLRAVLGVLFLRVWRILVVAKVKNTKKAPKQAKMAE